jgi:hypothetical protein
VPKKARHQRQKLFKIWMVSGHPNHKTRQVLSLDDVHLSLLTPAIKLYVEVQMGVWTSSLWKLDLLFDTAPVAKNLLVWDTCWLVWVRLGRRWTMTVGTQFDVVMLRH